ncbi:unnamed protein product [Spirodela intermedia]|uniref:DYW domain-containing protein n=1 Tax=Spirodela intermedia TaxID=51605 RepID=A0A7I8J0Y3_SPIIN|nr:unnamed protein product [Spirodela intermedia]CAA6663886.1 unnamed protein product [Spirodela intermedia]
MYCKCGDLESAHLLFDRMTKRNLVSWNSLISGYSLIGRYQQTLGLFLEGRSMEMEPDRFTYAGVLRGSAHLGDLKMGIMIHGLVVVSGVSSQVLLTNSLIDMYAKCGRIDLARLVLDHSHELDEVSWNSLLSGYVHLDAQRGVQINGFALGSIFKACAGSSDYSSDFGSIAHGFAVKVGLEMDVVVCGAMLDKFLKRGAVKKAIETFKLMPEQNVIVFNTMIAGLCGPDLETSDQPYYALSLFSDMKRRGMKPSKFTFSSVLKACNVIVGFEPGKQIHAQVLKHNLQKDEFIGSGLIDLYSNNGLIEDGLRCFDSTYKQDVVSWTSMISGFVQSEQFERACDLFHKLLVSGQKPDEFTLSSVMSACANLAIARTGEQVHSRSMKTGFNNFTVCVNSLIFMYAKSGDIDAAAKAFSETCDHDVKMKDYGFVPNSVIFLGVLTACSHGGLLDEGLRSFDSMKRDYNLEPNVKHYASIVDLLGRAGKLPAAEDLILSSGFASDPVIWKALLGSCRLHGDVNRAARVAERIIELNPHESSSYVLLYNIYFDAGERLLADNVRNKMKKLGVKKEPGLSWIIIGPIVHSFTASDKSHPQSRDIYSKLEEMVRGVKETEEQVVQNFHSERLAVALGMMVLPESAPIRVMKNLRVCRDCHTMMKLFSYSERREIVLRDPSGSIASPGAHVLAWITGNK